MAPRSTACNRVFSLPRALVSQNKRRFQQDGFDLDLGYVHPRVIVMGYPSVGVEYLYRNPRAEVVRFLEERHADNYFVYNFCDETSRCYPARVFAGRAKSFPMEDHNVPTLQDLTAFCEDAAAWLDADENHVVALHCKAGKGRAGMMACMLLVRMGIATTAKDAIDRYNRERVRDRRGLTVVSQKKWVHYYAALLAQSPCPVAPGGNLVEPDFVIQKLVLRNTLTGAKLPKLRLRIFQLDTSGSTKTLLHQDTGFGEFSPQQSIRGSVLLEFYRARYSDCMRAKHFKVWFNTFFLQPDAETGVVTFTRSEMDWVARDKKHRRFPAAFELEMVIAGSNEP